MWGHESQHGKSFIRLSGQVGLALWRSAATGVGDKINDKLFKRCWQSPCCFLGGFCLIWVWGGSASCEIFVKFCNLHEVGPKICLRTVIHFFDFLRYELAPIFTVAESSCLSADPAHNGHFNSSELKDFKCFGLFALSRASLFWSICRFRTRFLIVCQIAHNGCFLFLRTFPPKSEQFGL